MSIFWLSLYQLDAVRSSQRRKERTGDKSGSRERSRSANQRKAAPYTSPQDIQLDQDGSEQVNGSGEDRMAIGTNMATARHSFIVEKYHSILMAGGCTQGTVCFYEV